MSWIRGMIVFLALGQAGWMIFNGAHALAVGTYLTPSRGPQRGQLGPWAGVVSSMGIDPSSTVMKSIFIVYGLAWIAVTYTFIRNKAWSRLGMLLMVFGSLWYIGVHTPLSLAQIFLLILLPVHHVNARPG